MTHRIFILKAKAEAKDPPLKGGWGNVKAGGMEQGARGVLIDLRFFHRRRRFKLLTSVSSGKK